MIISLICFGLAIAAYTVSQLQQHNKLRWQNEDHNFFGFWGRNSWVRKYKGKHKNAAVFENIKSPNWYYRFFKIKYKERFPLSATLLVNLTDGYHACQFIAGLFISLSFVPLLGWTYGIAFWILAHVIHWSVYRFLQR